MMRCLRYAPVAFLLLAIGATASCGSDDNSGNSGSGGGGNIFPTGCNKSCQSGLCDPHIGCVECLGNSDCKDAGQPICVVGHCQACGSKADCGTGQSCFPLEHHCAPSCTTNANCTQGEAHICDTMSGACVGCLTNMDCAGGPPLCDTTLGHCAECLQDTDCGKAAPYCNTSSGHCEQCLVDSQCPMTGQVCRDHECVTPPPPCTTDMNCGGDTPHCLVATGVCVECTATAQCANNDHGHFCSPENNCVECLMSTDCPMGQTCNGNHCHG